VQQNKGQKSRKRPILVIAYVITIVVLAFMDKIAEHFGFAEGWHSIKVVAFVVVVAGLLIELLRRLGRRR
jgi:uncharacterized membrane protein